jgi:hypothetical protein
MIGMPIVSAASASVAQAVLVRQSHCLDVEAARGLPGALVYPGFVGDANELVCGIMLTVVG